MNLKDGLGLGIEDEQVSCDRGNRRGSDRQLLHQQLRARRRPGGRRADPPQGIEHLELALRGHNFGGLVIPESAVITEKADDAEVEAFREHLARHGVKISGCNVGGADIRTRDGLELTDRRIRFAARWFGWRSASGAGQPTDAQERRTVVEHLRRLGDTAAEHGVTLALETHKGPTQNATAMLALMDEVDHATSASTSIPAISLITIDGADPCDELERVKHLVRNVHVKDDRGGFEDWYFPAGRRRQRRLRPSDSYPWRSQLKPGPRFRDLSLRS